MAEAGTELELRAGPQALERIRAEGLRPEMVRGLAGAAGGPKWLALHHLDRLLFGHWLPQAPRPRFLIGSSIATWRFAMGAQQDPEAAYERFARTYIHEQRYSQRPTPAEVSAEARRLVDVLLGPDGPHEILNNTRLQLQIMAVRCRGLLRREGAALGVGLALAGAGNLLSRRTLALGFQRALFQHPESTQPLPDLNHFGLRRYRLTERNLRSALLASGSIPTVMEPERDIPGADPGVYRDGGLVDYQMAVDYGSDGDIVLFPHYEHRMVPGWFDKPLPWRRAPGGAMDSVLLVAPSAGFVESLPRRRIPDRKDFYRYAGDDAARARDWQRVSDATRRLADAFHDACESGRIRYLIKPL
ncbi:MAG: patatin-like phospholipase family protein [Ectothiorhodospiraceae bacterium]|nr:patatin-like phospholipase family protein [Ectothiorhodospiraceae bacterium]